MKSRRATGQRLIAQWASGIVALSAVLGVDLLPAVLAGGPCGEIGALSPRGVQYQ